MAMSDAAARETALDPTQSFIVQAPAGSGKTELLIQRYLALLATVQQPEQVVAITFTRKAAAEMRRRVQRALRAAADTKPSEQPHERTAYELARAVVARDRALDWQVLAQPQRLRIDTLDAFNAWLARQLPVLAGGVAAADVVDKPDDLHREAARRCVSGIAGDNGAFGRACARCCATSATTSSSSSGCSRRCCHAAINGSACWAAKRKCCVPGSRVRCSGSSTTSSRPSKRCARSGCSPRWAPLLRHAAGAASDGLRATLAPWLALDRPPTGGPVALAAWRGIAALLLTKQGEWRKRVAKPEGSDLSTLSLAIGCVPCSTS